jgi:hypothetical protein
LADEFESVEPAYDGDPDLQEPPALTFGNVVGVLRRKGFVGAMTDEAMGPHIHLITIIGIVVIISVVVGIVGMM